MNKFFIILSLFLFILFSAQSKQFIYEYKFVPDSTNKKNILTEMMILNIEKEKSEFFGIEKYSSDSTIVAEAEKGIFSMPPNKEFINYRVIKFPNTHEIEFVSPLISGKYFVKQEIKLQWNILPESTTYLNLPIQKATTNFVGRTWIAWFTREIPFQDGPYKFFGLPGLIVRLEDITESHKYELKGIKNLENNFTYPEVNNSKEYKVSYSEYTKVYKNFRKHPVASLAGKIPDQKDHAGNFKSGAEILRNLEKIQLEKIAKDNNIIEINLLDDK